MRCGQSPRTRWGKVGWTLALALLPAAAAAEPATTPNAAATPAATAAGEVSVSWQAIATAVERHPSVAAAHSERRAARAGIDAAGAAPNPNLEVTTAYGRARDGSASRMEWGAELTVPVGWLAQRRARVDAARAHADAAGAATDALRRELLVELHGAFWSLVYAQERVTALAELSEQTTALATTVRRRVEAGESRPVEVARVEVEEERVLAELGVARAETEARRQQLALWLGLPPDQRLVAIADLSVLPRPTSADAARDRVRQRHPAVAAATAQVHALAADVSTERRTRVPDFALGLFADSELDRSAYGAKLSMDLPLWNWNTGNVRRAEWELAAARQRLEAQRLQVESAAIELQASCAASTALAARYRDRMRPRAAEATHSIERSYELGESSLLEVLDARRTFLETRTEFLVALARAQRDCSRLAILLGEDLP
jgi:cobalt-zinc-cadmium efflux system outer membrane protein